MVLDLSIVLCFVHCVLMHMLITYQVVIRKLRSHIRLDKTWANSVHCNTSRRKFFRVTHGKPNHTTLGSSIVSLSWVTKLSNDGGDVDDTSGTLLGCNLQKIQTSKEMGDE